MCRQSLEVYLIEINLSIDIYNGNDCSAMVPYLNLWLLTFKEMVHFSSEPESPYAGVQQFIFVTIRSKYALVSGVVLGARVMTN